MQKDAGSNPPNSLSNPQAIQLWQQFSTEDAPSSLHAIDQLYRSYHAEIYRYCQSILRDAGRASEMAQEVFVRMLRLEKKPVIRSSVNGLLLRVARNLCLAELAKPRIKIQPAEPLDDPPDRQAAHDEELSALDECMSRLAEPERGMVALHHGDGLPYREIREILSIRLSFAGFTRRITKALNALRRCLKEKGVF